MELMPTATDGMGSATNRELQRYVIMGERAARVLEIRATKSWEKATAEFIKKYNTGGAK